MSTGNIHNMQPDIYKAITGHFTRGDKEKKSQDAVERVYKCSQFVLQKWKDAVEHNKKKLDLKILKPDFFRGSGVEMKTWMKWVGLILKNENLDVKSDIIWDRSNDSLLDSVFVEACELELHKKEDSAKEEKSQV